MKKLLCLSIVALATLTACGEISPEEFVKKVDEKSVSLKRIEYNYIKLDGSYKNQDNEIKSSEKSIYFVTWKNGDIDKLTPIDLLDPLMYALKDVNIKQNLVLNHDKAVQLTNNITGKPNITYTSLGIKYKGPLWEMEMDVEYKWNDELLMSTLYNNLQYNDLKSTINLSLNWKMLDFSEIMFDM